MHRRQSRDTGHNAQEDNTMHVGKMMTLVYMCKRLDLLQQC